GLKLTALHVPGSVQSGDAVRLLCEYDLDSETLYSVKWYKNNIEFFRYLPSDPMPGQVYELPGMFVDPTRSTKNTVYLARTDINSEGVYGCEVSTEGPAYQTVRGEKEMRIYVLPEEGPVIQGLSNSYHVGDVVNATCYSRPSRPRAMLRWFINNQTPSGLHQILHSGAMRHDNGLQSMSSNIQFTVRQTDVARGRLELKCMAYTLQTEGRFSEELVMGDRYLPKRTTNKRDRPTGEPRVTPMIHAPKDRYDVGDEANLNCTLGEVDKIVTLQWYINDKEARPENLRKFNGGSILNLRIRLQPNHFPNDELKLKCTATISREVTQSSDAFAYEANKYVSGLHLKSAGTSWLRQQNLHPLQAVHGRPPVMLQAAPEGTCANAIVE
ncbi:uncharacterized protein LOC100900311, partial [Galendromus occidentalis]|uniref:Uncharacterized protein LOC100900311 n=1 Tax=Galendromus occidentalis TaxID=34638 RepID=A0AAJ7SF40_9ACAR